MKNVFVGILSAVMVVYTIGRAFTIFAIMPFVASPVSATAIYFIVLLLAAFGSTWLSFTRCKGMSAALASAVGLVAVGYWWFVICGASKPIWAGFVWLVVPETCFSLAGLLKWLLSAPRLSGAIEGRPQAAYRVSK
jgi:hypothetical protein